MTEAVWYVIHTKPREEARCYADVTAKGFNSFLPLAREADKTKPLFPRYLFSLVHRNQDWWPLMRANGVSTILSDTFGFPVPVPVDQITAIRDQLVDDTLHIPKAARKASLKAGETVRIIDGAFRGWDGEIVRVSARERVDLLLDMVGRKTKISIQASQLAGG